jgi:hypothetical protein
MKTEYTEFAPLDFERAEELRDLINQAARTSDAIIIDPNNRGITGSTRVGLISPREKTNALVRYRRHY